MSKPLQVKQTDTDVLIIGGGTAGCYAALTISRNSYASVLVAEKANIKRSGCLAAGVNAINAYIVKGRKPQDYVDYATKDAAGIVRNDLLLTAAEEFNNVTADMERLGLVILKDENGDYVARGNRNIKINGENFKPLLADAVYSSKNVDVLNYVNITDLLTENGIVTGIQLTDNKVYTADAVIVATGGLSYPTTGSTGDGYRFAAETGHTVTECMPSLVPLTTKEAYIPLMKGLSLRNIELTVKRGKKTVYQDFGEMMFTHFGITGPLVLSASAKIGKFLQKGEELNAYLDLKPALSHEQLDDRILREFSSAQNKQFKNVIGVLFPSSLTPVIIGLGPIPEDKVIHDISREDRLAFGSLIKSFPFTITGLGGFSEAVITRGGVSVREIQPGTMESKKIKNLYFIGEVLDLDAVTGGYNLQIAWSTAYLAATDVCRNKQEDTQ